jgi:hypothetical protein
MGTTCTKSGLAPKQLAPKHPGQARRAATAPVTATTNGRVSVTKKRVEQLWRGKGGRRAVA